LDDITGALTTAGISGANLTQVYTFQSQNGLQSQTWLVWSFTLTAPLSKLSATLTELVSAQQTISSNNSGLTLTFYVEGLQISPQLQQSQLCSQATLLADAQAQAKQVAAAAGVTSGAILSMSEGTSAGAILQLVPTQAIAGNVITTGAITSVLGYASFISPPAVLPTPRPTCSLTMQFQLM
jgi:hypothetical protein